MSKTTNTIVIETESPSSFPLPLPATSTTTAPLAASSANQVAREDDVQALGSRLYAVVCVDSLINAQKLIMRGANVNYRSATGGTPLTAAVTTGDLEMIVLLWTNNANFDVEDGSGKGLIMIAMKSKQKEAAQLVTKILQVKQGNAKAQYEFACELLEMGGINGPGYIEKVWELLQAAAKSKYPAAQNLLEDIHKSCANGDFASLNPLAKRAKIVSVLAGMYWDMEDHEEKTLQLMRFAIHLGDPDAMYNLASIFIHGDFGKKDPEEAILLLNKASILGDQIATLELAKVYLTNAFGTQNKTKAVSLLFEFAIKFQNSGILMPLADCYENGAGVKQDGNKADLLREIALTDKFEQFATKIAQMYEGFKKEQSLAESSSTSSSSPGQKMEPPKDASETKPRKKKKASQKKKKEDKKRKQESVQTVMPPESLPPAAPSLHAQPKPEPKTEPVSPTTTAVAEPLTQKPAELKASSEDKMVTKDVVSTATVATIESSPIIPESGEAASSVHIQVSPLPLSDIVPSPINWKEKWLVDVEKWFWGNGVELNEASKLYDLVASDSSTVDAIIGRAKEDPFIARALAKLCKYGDKWGLPNRPELKAIAKKIVIDSFSQQPTIVSGFGNGAMMSCAQGMCRFGVLRPGFQSPPSDTPQSTDSPKHSH